MRTTNSYKIITIKAIAQDFPKAYNPMEQFLKSFSSKA